MPQIFLDSLRDSLSAELTAIVEAVPLMPLDAGAVDAALATYLTTHTDRALGADLPKPSRTACLSGLWLLAGDLERSHSISQDLSSTAGSFWHGIMHRREGDFGNAKYWFRRVGSHPVLSDIVSLAGTSGVSIPENIVGGSALDPCAFVDACQTAMRTGTGKAELQDVQWLEWQCLFADAS